MVRAGPVFYFCRMSNLVAPSLLSANFADLKPDIEMLNESEADWFHMDVMDGVFVPNISFGIPVIKAVKKYTDKPLDCHLMIVQPEKYIDAFAAAGADILTVHVEASPHLHRTVQAIHAAGMKAGVSLNPHTPVSSIEHMIPDLDLVLIMSVNPGFGGQKFIEFAYEKVAEVSELADELNPELFIEVDGGVNEEIGRQLVAEGANVLVAGSYVFKADDPKAAISSLKY
jgi:ribulose-phosphate 3-epimerase